MKKIMNFVFMSEQAEQLKIDFQRMWQKPNYCLFNNKTKYSENVFKTKWPFLFNTIKENPEKTQLQTQKVHVYPQSRKSSGGFEQGASIELFSMRIPGDNRIKYRQRSHSPWPLTQVEETWQWTLGTQEIITQKVRANLSHLCYSTKDK